MASNTPASSNTTAASANVATNGQGTDGCTNCGAAQSTDGTPLSTCAKCHSRKYCSRACQAERWPFHKTFCAKKPTQAVDDNPPPIEQLHGYGIVTVPLPSISPDHCNATGHRMCTPPPPPGMLTFPGWRTIPITTAVGMPMQMIPSPVSSALHLLSNGTVDALGINIDPTSATFGQIDWAPNRTPTGECLLTRVDGGEISHDARPGAISLCRRRPWSRQSGHQARSRGEIGGQAGSCGKVSEPKSVQNVFRGDEGGGNWERPGIVGGGGVSGGCGLRGEAAATLAWRRCDGYWGETS